MWEVANLDILKIQFISPEFDDNYWKTNIILPRTKMDELNKKYWWIEWKIIEWTQYDLQDLKKSIQEQNYIRLDEILARKKIETKVYAKEEWWYNAVSIENTTQWINSDRLTKAKDTINKALDDRLRKYDFLWDRKEMFKLAIINKILYNPVSQKIVNYLESITKIFENPKDLFTSTDKTTHISNREWNDLSLSVEGIIKPYIDLFDQINWKFEELDKNNVFDFNWDKSKRKINLISHIDFFTNPNSMQWNFDSKAILSQFDELLNNPKNFNSPKELTEEDKKILVDYMMKSRWNIEKTLKTLESWDRVRDIALTIWDNKYVKWFLETLFKIPILWKILAIFLWLNPDKPMDDFNEQTKTFKTLKWLKNLWAIKDKNWSLSDNSVDTQLKSLDLSEINHSETKPELKQINDFKNSITIPVDTKTTEATQQQSESKDTKTTQITKPKYEKDEDFWKEAFSDDWVEKDWVKLKFEISDTQIADWKISTEEFKEIVKKWFSKYNEGIGVKVEADKKVAEDKSNNDKKKQEEDRISKIIMDGNNAELNNTEIQSVIDFINSEDKNDIKLKDYDVIKNMKISEIIKSKDLDFGALLTISISLNDYEKLKLKQLFKIIKTVIWEDKENLYSTKTLNDFLIKNWWFIESLNNEKKKNDWLIYAKKIEENKR